MDIKSILYYVFSWICITLLILFIFTSNYEHTISSTLPEYPLSSAPAIVEVTTLPDGSKYMKVTFNIQISVKTSLSGTYFETKKFIIHTFSREALQQIAEQVLDYQNDKILSIRNLVACTILSNVYFYLTLLFFASLLLLMSDLRFFSGLKLL